MSIVFLCFALFCNDSYLLFFMSFVLLHRRLQISCVFVRENQEEKGKNTQEKQKQKQKDDKFSRIFGSKYFLSSPLKGLRPEDP
jgi:hypothetical protein